MDKTMYVIRLKTDGQKEKFYVRSDYGWWSEKILYASFYHSIDAAKEDLANDVFTKDCVESDGTKSPPVMIHIGLDICNAKPKATGIIDICEIKISPVYTKEVSGELKRPKKVTYEY